MDIKYVDSFTNDVQAGQIADLIRQEADHMLQLDEAKIREIVAKKEAIIAISRDNAVGFTKYFPNGVEADGTEILECGSLVVDKEWRSKGVGKRLLQELLKQIRRSHQKALPVGVVRTTNNISCGFLISIGGKKIAKPKSMTLYPLGWSEDKFHIIDLSGIS